MMILGLGASDLVFIVAFVIIMVLGMAIIEIIIGPMMVLPFMVGIMVICGIGLFYVQNEQIKLLEEENDFLYNDIEDLETQNADLKNHQVPFAA